MKLTKVNKPIFFRQVVMKQIFTRRFIITLLYLGLVACQGSGDSKSTDYTGVQDNITTTIDTYLDANQDSDKAGVSIIVRKDGDVVYRRNKGMANTLTGIPISSDTGFRLASVSKPFTAFAILQLYEQGVITLDDKLLNYIP